MLGLFSTNTARRGRLLCVIFWGLTAAQTVADDGTPEPFCGVAQQVLAGTAIVPEVEVQSDYDAFVASKSSDSPFIVQQFLSNPAPEDAGLARTLSCKMRTAERINSVQGTPEAVRPAEGDSDCAEVHRHMLEGVAASIPQGQRALEATSVIIEEEQTTYMGPMWLQPWPFDAVTLDEEGRLRLHARALYVPFAWWIPMPERFQGNYYCHLVAPAYLEALLRGQSHL